jgi:hypothetical protein
MAQDVYAAFGVGDSDRHISVVDADGVALAAIQGLHRILQEKEEEIHNLKEEIRSIQRRLGLVEIRVGTVTQE